MRLSQLKILITLVLPMSFALPSMAQSSSTERINSPERKSSSNNPELIKALRAATYNPQERRSDLDMLTWLSTMSSKIERRIPDPHYRIDLLKTVLEEARRADLDPQLVLAVIEIESNFNRHAISHAGAQGLMQVMPFWKEVYGNVEDDLYQYRVSLRYGCTILRHYIDKYPTTAQALAAYNGSLGRTTYSDKVLNRLQKRWQFKGDKYSRNYEQRTIISASESISDRLNLN